MDRKTHVLIKDPGKPPRSVNISTSLENLQKTVGGYIESVRLVTDWTILCDEDGKLKDKPYNCTICGADFVGTIVFIGTKKSEFTDFPVEYKTMKKLFPQLWQEGE